MLFFDPKNAFSVGMLVLLQNVVFVGRIPFLGASFFTSYIDAVVSPLLLSSSCAFGWRFGHRQGHDSGRLAELGRRGCGN